MIHPMLSDRCLSVTLLYCGQTVERIRMPLGMELGLSPGNTVLDGDPAPPKGHILRLPQFLAMSVATKMLDGSRCHLVWRQASAQVTLC